MNELELLKAKCESLEFEIEVLKMSKMSMEIAAGYKEILLALKELKNNR